MAKLKSFGVPGLPMAQPRQRHRVLFKGKKAFAHNYTPKNSPVNGFKAAVRMAAAAAYRDAPTTGPMQAVVVFVLPRTAGQIWKKRPMPRLPHAKKPDGENLVKSALDAMKEILWKDDCQVFDIRIVKLIACGEEQPHVEVYFQERQTVPRRFAVPNAEGVDEEPE